MYGGLLSFFFGDEDFAMVVHEENVLEVFFLSPFSFQTVLVVFLYSPLINLLTLLLVHGLGFLWGVRL